MTRPMTQNRANALKTIDGRTREGRALRDLRAQLIQHVGGKPSVTQKALIERACMLALHVAKMEARAAEGRVMSEQDSRQYLAWSNSYTRTLRQLGTKGAPPAPQTLAERRAARVQAA
jgi:hypothetical protein